MTRQQDAPFSARAIELVHGTVSLRALLYTPQSSFPRPALIVSPAGLALGDLEAYAWAGQRFARAGYVVLIHTYRAASPYGDTGDIRLAMDHLVTLQEVDKARISVFGHSRGGVGALLAASQDQRIQAVISIAAVVDIADYVSRVASFSSLVRDAVVAFMGGSPDESAEAYESVRVLSRAGLIKQPVLLIHGTADMRVPMDHSTILNEALIESGNGAVHLEKVPGMGHYLEQATRGYAFDQLCELTTRWLKKALGTESPLA